MKLAFWIGGIIVATILIFALVPFTIIGAGERGVVLRFGKVDRVMPEGMHYRTPFVEDVEKLDVRTQKEAVTSNSASKDLQIVSTEIALNYNLEPDKVGELWSKIGKDYKSRVIDPSIQEAVKAATAKYTAEELVTKRELVREDIKQALTARLSHDNITVTEVSIVNFDFSPGFNEAIEAKVTAEQQALQAKNKLEQVKYEAEQQVAQAEAEAKSIRLQSDAANNEKYVALKRIEVQLEMAKKWNGQLPVNMYGAAPIPFIDLSQ